MSEVTVASEKSLDPTKPLDHVCYVSAPKILGNDETYGPQFIAEETVVVAGETHHGHHQQQPTLDAMGNLQNGILVDINSYACNLSEGVRNASGVTNIILAESLRNQVLQNATTTTTNLTSPAFMTLANHSATTHQHNSATTSTDATSPHKNPTTNEDVTHVSSPLVTTAPVNFFTTQALESGGIQHPQGFTQVTLGDDPKSKCEVVILESPYTTTLQHAPTSTASVSSSVHPHGNESSLTVLNGLTEPVQLPDPAQKNELKKAKDRDKKRLQRKDPEYREKEREASVLRMRSRRQDPVYRSIERVRDKMRRRVWRQEHPEKRSMEKERDKLAKRQQRMKLLRVPVSLVTSTASTTPTAASNGLSDDLAHQRISQAEDKSVVMDASPLGFRVGVGGGVILGATGTALPGNQSNSMMMEVYHEMVIKSESASHTTR